MITGTQINLVWRQKGTAGKYAAEDAEEKLIIDRISEILEYVREIGTEYKVTKFQCYLKQKKIPPKRLLTEIVSEYDKAGNEPFSGYVLGNFSRMKTPLCPIRAAQWIQKFISSAEIPHKEMHNGSECFHFRLEHNGIFCESANAKWTQISRKIRTGFTEIKRIFHKEIGENLVEMRQKWYNMHHK